MDSLRFTHFLVATIKRVDYSTTSSACWVFLCFRNPLDWDMDYRIFAVRTWSFLCVHIYTHWGWAHWQRVCITFLTWKNLQIFLVLLTEFEPRSIGSWIRRSTNEATPSPQTYNAIGKLIAHDLTFQGGDRKNCWRERTTPVNMMSS